MDTSFRHINPSLNRESPLSSSQSKIFTSGSELDLKVDEIMRDVQLVNQTMLDTIVSKGGKRKSEGIRHQIYRYHSRATSIGGSLTGVLIGTPASSERKVLPRHHLVASVAAKVLPSSLDKDEGVKDLESYVKDNIGDLQKALDALEDEIKASPRFERRERATSDGAPSVKRVLKKDVETQLESTLEVTLKESTKGISNKKKLQK